MRKVKFAQDCFDEKLGAILTEFPMLDVRLPLRVSSNYFVHSADLHLFVLFYVGPSSIPIVADERSIRQEPLQACPWPTAHCAPSYRPCCEGLRPPAEIR